MGLLVLVFGTARAQDATAEPAKEMKPWVCPDGFKGQTLNVFNWSTYIAEDTIANFQTACGVTVKYDTFASNDELIAKLRQGNPGYDIVVPTDYIIPTMVGENLLEKLDQTKIPNLKNISPDLANPPYDPGNGYTVPYEWGTIGIGYDKAKVKEDINSWTQLFQYKGPVSWIEDKRSMLGIGLIMSGFDPNSTNADEVKKAKEFLIANAGNVKTIAQDDGQEQLAKGESDMVIEYSGDIFQKITECADANTKEAGSCKQDIVYVIPKEGANIWVDNLAIPKGAQNPALANVFIDYILDPKVGADISNYVAYASPNQAAIDAGLIQKELMENPAIYPSAEVRKRLFFIKSNPDAEQLYNDAWDEIKIKAGKGG
jgi:spermidine/putrescine transport system substrate-binding protein